MVAALAQRPWSVCVFGKVRRKSRHPSDKQVRSVFGWMRVIMIRLDRTKVASFRDRICIWLLSHERFMFFQTK